MKHNLTSNQPGQLTYRHAVTIASGSILPMNDKGTFNVIQSHGEGFWPIENAELVRVAVGPGFADFRLADMYVSQLVAGSAHDAAYGPWLATTRHSGVKPVAAQNPFAGGWESFATPFAKRIDAAIA